MLKQIISLEQDMLTSSSNLYIHWYDKRLKWNLKKFPISFVTLQSFQIWYPSDLFIINSLFYLSIDLNNNNNNNNYFYINQNGLVTVNIGLNGLKTKCKMNIYKYPFDEQVDKKWRSKVTFLGITYNSTGPAKKPAKQVDEVTKYYSCGMVQETRNGPWKQDQQKRGTETTTKQEDIKCTKKGGNGGGIKCEKKLTTSSKMKCSGTLIATYRRFGRHSYTISRAHKCQSGQVCSGELDNRIPMVVITPNVSWDVRRDKLMVVKEQLVKLGQKNWNNLRGCGKDRQYLFLSNDGTKHNLLKNDVEECIEPFVLNYITKTNPKVNR
jgi:hypothetical protein